MWIVKGVGLGLLLFMLFVAFRYFMLIGPPRQRVATGLSALVGVTIGSPFFWLGLMCCVGLGICILASIPVRVQP